MPASSPTIDLCVIGGGTAGHALALAAAALGARCAVVDPRSRLGRGQAADLADAMLLDAAHARARAADAAPFDLAAFRLRLGRALADLAPTHAAERLRTLGVTLVQARPAFADPRTLVAGGNTIRARRFVLAPGGSPAVPDWAASLAPARLLPPATLALLHALPDHVAVVAETPEGLAWAQALRRLGAAVTLIAAPGTVSPFDLELMRPVFAALRREGVELRLDRTVAHAEDTGETARLHLDGAGGEPVVSSHVLIAAAPVPAVAGLELERAGIACTRGAPTLDAGLRTSNPRVFAIGDVRGVRCPGGADVPHQVGLVLRAALFRQPVRYRSERVPVTLATEPALAQVGTLALAGPVAGRRVLRWPLADTMRGQAADGPDGGATIVTTGGGRVLGAGLAGPSAAEAIVPWTLALANGIPVGTLARLPVPDAALVEASRRAGLNLLAARLASPWIRRALALLRALP